MVVPRRAQSALAALPPLSSAWSIRIVRKLTRGSPCFTGLIDGYCSHWLRRLFRPHWAYYSLFPPQAAAFVRPHQFPLKSCGFSGAETARKRFLLWKMGFSDAACCEPMHPSIQHGRSASSHRPALTLARCSVAAHYALLRVLATSALRASAARRLACGSPCFIGLTSRCFAHSARASCAPAVHAAGDD